MLMLVCYDLWTLPWSSLAHFDGCRWMAFCGLGNIHVCPSSSNLTVLSVGRRNSMMLKNSRVFAKISAVRPSEGRERLGTESANRDDGDGGQ
jgi:hypothetical protein